MDTLKSHGFNKCKPPVCSEDIDITITNFTCVTGKIVHVEWVVTDVYNRNLGINVVKWSCGSDLKNYQNIVTPNNDTQPYKASFSVLDCEGSVDIKIRIRVGTTFFESEPDNINIVDCQEDLENPVVHADRCEGNCSLGSQTPPAYSLYVKTGDIPSYPVYFDYDGYCWVVWNDNNIVDIDKRPDGSILMESMGNIFTDCDNCCNHLDYPSPWKKIGDEDDEIGTYYFEYQTYRVRDHLYVIKNFNSETDCNEETPPQEKILFSTGCVSTNVDNIVELSKDTGYPQFFVSHNQCFEPVPFEIVIALPDRTTSYRPTYGFYVTVRKSELPLGIVLDCACDSDEDTLWRICIIDPGGGKKSFSDGTECLCESYGEVCGGGAGTIEEPIILCDIIGVLQMENGKYYKLGQDIDASETINFQRGRGFPPIAFANGGLDGDNYAINDLYINFPSLNYVGLFASTETVTIKNLTLNNATITGNTNVGALIGFQNAETIVTDCHIYTSSITGNLFVGGFVGDSRFGSISDCSVNGTTVTGGSFVGGFTGKDSSVISNCSADCVVSGTQYLGGFVGMTYWAGGISESFAEGSVSASLSTPIGVGGFVGRMFYDSSINYIIDCFSRSEMEIKEARNGGFCGFQDISHSSTSNVITNCYYAGSQTGTTGGAFNGSGGANINDSFWDDTLIAIGTSNGGTDKTTGQMKTAGTFSAWDLITIWDIDVTETVNNGYPYLRNTPFN